MGIENSNAICGFEKLFRSGRIFFNNDSETKLCSPYFILRLQFRSARSLDNDLKHFRILFAGRKWGENRTS
jgi:hypothetical protein